ncbi:C69 family dipeptidase [Azotobacter salinestris]|uniref:C69 family dipeptidase n=1 Tax=Azotobacter salinestris TaxID=69964 RepID=UPI0032DF1E01
MCINIAIGREASTGKQTMVCRNEDGSRHGWNRYLAYRHAPEYASSQVVRDGQWILGNGLSVCVPASRFAYSAMPGTVAGGKTGRHLHEGRGINENNVAVSTTNGRAMNLLARAADPLLVEGGVSEAVIPTLLLPQALSARHGIELLGGYIAVHGASEASGVIVADPLEAWYLETGSAHHWIAVRVPADSYLVVAGGMRVHDVDLDGDDVLHSPGLFEFVRDQRLLACPSRQRFDFARAFGVPGSAHDAERIWLAQKHLTPSLRQSPRRARHPLFLKPDTPLCVADVMTVLRSTSTWRVFESRRERPSPHDQVEASHIICLNGEMPTELQGLIWQTLGSPLGTPYLPLYHALQEIPHELSHGSDPQGSHSAYRAFKAILSLAGGETPEALAALQAMWHAQEQEFIFQQYHLKAMLISMYQQSPQSALAFAQHYSTGSVLQMVEKAQRECQRLMTSSTEKRNNT